MFELILDPKSDCKFAPSFKSLLMRFGNSFLSAWSMIASHRNYCKFYWVQELLPHHWDFLTSLRSWFVEYSAAVLLFWVNNHLQIVSRWKTFRHLLFMKQVIIRTFVVMSLPRMNSSCSGSLTHHLALLVCVIWQVGSEMSSDCFYFSRKRYRHQLTLYRFCY